MSLFDYRAAAEISKTDPPFYALIMAAMSKADTAVTANFAAVAVLAAAKELRMSPTDLDHGIWSWQRRQRSRTRS